MRLYCSSERASGSLLPAHYFNVQMVGAHRRTAQLQVHNHKKGAVYLATWLEGAHCELCLTHFNLLKKTLQPLSTCVTQLYAFLFPFECGCAYLPICFIDHLLINIIICVANSSNFPLIVTKPSVSQQNPQQQPFDCDNFTVICRPAPVAEA